MIDWRFWEDDDPVFQQHEVDYMGADPSKRETFFEGGDKYFDIIDGGCIWCGNDEFLKGPTAGLAVNVKCSGCGEKYNVMPFGEDKAVATPLSRREIVKLL